MLILQISEPVSSFHLLISSSISLFKHLKFLSYMSFTCLSVLLPRYFIQFVAIVNDVLSLISFSAYLSFACIGILIFFISIIFNHIAEDVFQLKEFPGKIWGSVMYAIISFANWNSLISSFPICIIPLFPLVIFFGLL